MRPGACPEYDNRDHEGRELGTVPPHPPCEDHPERRWELVSVDDHHWLQAGPTGVACVPAHLAIAGHARLPDSSEFESGTPWMASTASSSRRYASGSASPSACAASAARMAACRFARLMRV